MDIQTVFALVTKNVLTIQTFLISLIASIFTVMGGKFWDSYWAKRSNEEELHYLVIRLVFLFDSYAAECVKKVKNHDSIEVSDGYLGEPITDVPDFPELPSSDVYKKLDHSILWSVYNFPQVVQQHKSKVDEQRILTKDENADLFHQLAIRQVIKTGLKAIYIADMLRHRYSLVISPLNPKSKDSDYLQKTYKSLKDLESWHKEIR